MIKITCIYPTLFSWYTYSSRIVGIMRWIRGLIFYSQYMSRFLLHCIFHSSTFQYVDLPYVCIAWSETASLFTDLSWCLIRLRVCQGAPFLQWKIKLRLHHLGCCRHMRSCRPSTWALHQWYVDFLFIGLSYCIWRAVVPLVPVFKHNLLPLHNLLWGGAPNMFLIFPHII